MRLKHFSFQPCQLIQLVERKEKEELIIGIFVRKEPTNRKLIFVQKAECLREKLLLFDQVKYMRSTSD